MTPTAHPYRPLPSPPVVRTRWALRDGAVLGLLTWVFVAVTLAHHMGRRWPAALATVVFAEAWQHVFLCRVPWSSGRMRCQRPAGQAWMRLIVAVANTPWDIYPGNDFRV